MVFRGKPSGACHSCRERRLKCDTVRPKCGQCFRAQRDCPGYRPQMDVRFFDQTGEVLAKAGLAGNARTKRSLSNRTTVAKVPDNIVQPVEARALSFFFSKYIPGSSFEYLTSFYTPHMDKEEQLSASIEAVGLASLSNELGSLEVSEQARKRYVYAIKATKTALQSSMTATRDSTLLAVLLLGLYEIITCTVDTNLCLWESHMMGALALIQLRDRGQMQSRLGIHLIDQVTAGAVLIAHRIKAEVAPEVFSLVAYGLQWAKENGTLWRLRLISIRVANLRAAVNTKSLFDPDTIIAAAMELDNDLVNWSRTLPPSWQFETHCVEEANSTLVHEGYYHLYPTYGVAQGMNTWRALRVQLNELIWDQSLRRPTSSLISQDQTTLLHQVGSTIRSLCSEVCAAVPQYLELPAATPSSVSVCRAQSPSPVIRDAPVHSLKASGSGFTHLARSYGIIWPLMVVANCVIPHSSRRAWVINRLQYISRRMRNPQARIALEILEGKLDASKR